MITSRLPTPAQELIFSASLSATEARKLQRQVLSGQLSRVYSGIYAAKQSDEELKTLVRRNWQRIVGVVVPGGVVSHLSAMRGGLLISGEVILSHPTSFNRKVLLPGVTVRVVRGPGPLPGDLSIGTSGIQFASRARMLLENIGRKGDLRASIADVEEMLVAILNSSGEKALNELRDQAAGLASPLGGYSGRP